MDYEKTFHEKIDFFKEHEKYGWLRGQADIALRNRSGVGLSAIIFVDFMDRIVAMPLDYIQAWLDGQNQLNWRRQDKLMIDAIKGNYVELQEKLPNIEIHKISTGQLDFYKSLDFELLEEKDGFCFVGKVPHKVTLNEKIESASRRSSESHVSGMSPARVDSFNL